MDTNRTSPKQIRCIATLPPLSLPLKVSDLDFDNCRKIVVSLFRQVRVGPFSKHWQCFSARGESQEFLVDKGLVDSSFRP